MNNRDSETCDIGRPAGVHERVSSFEGVSSAFVSSFRGILSAADEGEAMAYVVAALHEALSPRTFTVTSINDAGDPIVVDNYRDGLPWNAHIGEVVPHYALARTIRETGSPVFWDTNAARLKAPNWFIYPYFVGVPVKLSDAGEDEPTTGTFVLSFDDPARFCDATAVIASIVASAYATVVGNSTWINRGIEIGTSIAQERMVQRLHDTSVQEIFASECAVKALLDQPEAQEVRSDLERILSLLRSANRDLRSVLADASAAPRPGAQPLVPVIQDVVAQHRRLGGCSVTIIAHDELTFPSTITHVIESITRECLANVRKHAQADNVIISCTVLNDIVALTISDDGVGFVPEVTNDQNTSSFTSLHFGMHNMSMLAKTLGGTFIVSSDPAEGGVTVRVRLPLARGVVVG